MKDAVDHLINDLLGAGQESSLSAHDLRKFQFELARHQAIKTMLDAKVSFAIRMFERNDCLRSSDQ
ncbi:hypothetical protein SY26_18910 [Paracoccus sp. 228]|nr:hypothetical protein SY26_18910 [Paracoccus sp. 228]